MENEELEVVETIENKEMEEVIENGDTEKNIEVNSGEEEPGLVESTAPTEVDTDYTEILGAIDLKLENLNTQMDFLNHSVFIFLCGASIILFLILIYKFLILPMTR